MKTNRPKERLTEYNDIIKENDHIYDRLARILGLSQCGFWILYALRAENTPLIQSELCAGLYLPKQTINSALKKMEKEGYLELVRGRDQRSKQILLTAKGTRLCERTVDQVIRIEQDAFEGLSCKEQDAFLSLFHKYTDLLKKNIPKITCPEGEENEHEDTII